MDVKKFNYLLMPNYSCKEDSFRPLENASGFDDMLVWLGADVKSSSINAQRKFESTVIALLTLARKMKYSSHCEVDLGKEVGGREGELIIGITNSDRSYNNSEIEIECPYGELDLSFFGKNERHSDDQVHCRISLNSSKYFINLIKTFMSVSGKIRDLILKQLRKGETVDKDTIDLNGKSPTRPMRRSQDNEDLANDPKYQILKAVIKNDALRRYAKVEKGGTIEIGSTDIHDRFKSAFSCTVGNSKVPRRKNDVGGGTVGGIISANYSGFYRISFDRDNKAVMFEDAKGKATVANDVYVQKFFGVIDSFCNLNLLPWYRFDIYINNDRRTYTDQKIVIHKGKQSNAGKIWVELCY